MDHKKGSEEEQKSVQKESDKTPETGNELKTGNKNETEVESEKIQSFLELPEAELTGMSVSELFSWYETKQKQLSEDVLLHLAHLSSLTLEQKALLAQLRSQHREAIESGLSQLSKFSLSIRSFSLPTSSSSI